MKPYFQKKNEQLTNSYLFIENIMKNKLSSKSLQKKIEKELYFSYSNLKNHYLPVNLSVESSKWLENKETLINKDLNNILEIKYDINSTNNKILSYINLQNIIKKLGKKLTTQIILSFFFHLLSKSNLDDKEMSEIENQILLGKELLKHFIQKSLKKEKKFLNFNREDFEQNLLTNCLCNYNLERISEIHLTLGGILTNILTNANINLIEETIITEKNILDKIESKRIFKLSLEAKKYLVPKNINSYMATPQKLPMIVPPKEWILDKSGKAINGGYLNNNINYIDDLFIPKIGYSTTTKLLENTIILDLINGINNVEFKINTNTLNFINLFAYKKNLLIDESDLLYQKYLTSSLGKVSKKELNIIKSKATSIYTQDQTLAIAKLYSHREKIFFPVKLDQRTRLYCTTEYLNYQATDLSKSLISFANSEPVNFANKDAILDFKAYGASLYLGASKKLSTINKAKWVDTNKDLILNLEYNDFLKGANMKFCFISFYFEYKKYIDALESNLSEFRTNLPIQLDASCNGYQHLSLLTKEKSLFKHLNFIKSTKNDIPSDFYNYVLIKIIDMLKIKYNNKEYMNNAQKLSLERLINFGITRSTIKKSLMVKSYNASIPKMIEYMKSGLTEKVIDKQLRWYNENDSTNYLLSEDIVLFITWFDKGLKSVFPKAIKFSNYLKDMIKICTRLNHPFPWILPSGAIVTSSYLKAKEVRIQPFIFAKKRYVFKYHIKGLYDSTKQLNATMPNFIHSLDASSLAILYQNFNNYSNKPNFYAIHDCFATTANKIKTLTDSLKLAYLNIYSDKNYIKTTHEHVLDSLKKSFGDQIMDKEYIYFNDGVPSKVLIPSIDELVDENVSIKDLNNSSYIIF